MNIENIIVGLIVLLCFIYILRRAFRKFKNKNNNKCGACANCNSDKGNSCH